MLGELELEARVELRTQSGERGVPGCDAGVVKAHQQICAPRKPLLISEGARGGVLWRFGSKSTARQDMKTVLLQRACKNRIEAGDERSKPKRGTDQTASARTRPA